MQADAYIFNVKYKQSWFEKSRFRNDRNINKESLTLIQWDTEIIISD